MLTYFILIFLNINAQYIAENVVNLSKSIFQLIKKILYSIMVLDNLDHILLVLRSFIDLSNVLISLYFSNSAIFMTQKISWAQYTCRRLKNYDYTGLMMMGTKCSERSVEELFKTDKDNKAENGKPKISMPSVAEFWQYFHCLSWM